MKRAVMAVALGAALWGCPAAPTTPDVSSTCSADAGPTNGLPTARLGRQVDGPFQPLIDGDVMPIVHGAQGGQHVHVSVQLFAKTTETWVYSFRIEAAASSPYPQGIELGSSTQAVAACGPGWTTSTYVRVYLQSGSAAGDAVLFMSARPQSAPPPDPDAGVGPLDQQVHVTLK